jgi:hypothetical protein
LKTSWLGYKYNGYKKSGNRSRKHNLLHI